jgi:transposase-like protein
VLGVASDPSEAEPVWTAFLRNLADRRLRGMELVMADDHKGLCAAASRDFQAAQQRCRAHWMRNALAPVATRQRARVAAMLCPTNLQDEAAAARDQWRKVADALHPRFAATAELMDCSEDNALAYMAFPKAH